MMLLLPPCLHLALLSTRKFCLLVVVFRLKSNLLLIITDCDSQIDEMAVSNRKELENVVVAYFVTHVMTKLLSEQPTANYAEIIDEVAISTLVGSVVCHLELKPEPSVPKNQKYEPYHHPHKTRRSFPRNQNY